MKANRFHVYMRSVDASYLEEAQSPVPNRKGRVIKWLMPKAVCFILLVIGLLIWKPWEDMQYAVTGEEMAAAGYAFVEPEGARNISYSFAEPLDEGAQVAQLEFTVSTSAYTLRALQTDAPCDLFDFPDADYELTWADGEYSFSFASADSHENWLCWNAPEEKVQYALYAAVDKADLLDLAVDILDKQGHPLAAAPLDAVNVKFDVFEDMGLTVRQTEFILDFDQFVYRIADMLTFSAILEDISGQGDFASIENVVINGADARLTYDEGGEGKITWIDAASGCICSLYMPDDATAQKLQLMAETLSVE